nr:hypothetical protein [Tanacetum cinerariifolium]
MTGNISYLSEYEPYDGGYVSFRHGGGKITGKGIIKTGKLEFENVYFMKELKYNLFSVSQICDNKNSVLFTDSECIMLGKDFKLKDDTNVLLRTPRQHNMYSIDLNNIVPHKNLTCLVAKASVDESMLWHRRLGHLNFKNMNKLVRNNLVKGLPSKCFENDHTCVAYLKGKQHKASCKTKLVNSVSKPLHTLHMDLFGPTSVSSLNHKCYCLVVTNDFSRFTWTFFLRTKDETSSILRNFITEIENLKDLKVKIIRCDNGREFKSKEMNEFYTKKGIRIEFNNARTPQQNGVAKKRNITLIEAARTMLADAKLRVTFWAEAVNTACYIQNRVLVNKSQNKTSYELFNSRIPSIGFLRPFGCHVMILNTLDHLGKFDAKGDEGYFVGYSLSSKAFRVFNKRTKKVEENLHVDFLENKLIEKGTGPNWLFDIDTLTNSMNYVPVVVAGKSSTNISGTKDVASQDVKKDVSSLRYIAFPNWFHEAHMEIRNSDAPDGYNADVSESSGISNPTATSKVPSADQVEPTVSLTVESKIPTVSSPVPTVCLDISLESSSGPRLITKGDFSQTETPSLGNALNLSYMFEDAFRVHKSKNMEEQSFIAIIHQKTNPDLLQFCLFSCFLSQEEPKKIFDALKDPIWVEAMQEELLQFKIQNVWVLVDCPKGVRPIGIKWVLKNKKDERGIVIRNKATLVAQGYTQEEGIEYEEVFAPVAKIKAIRLFLAYASFMGFVPPRFQDLEFLDRVYKVEKAMYRLHQAPRAWYGTFSKYLLDTGFQKGTINQTLFIRKHKGEFLLVQVYVDDIIFGSSNPQLCREFEALMHGKFQMSVMGELTFFLRLQVLQKKDGIFLSQDKYVGDILKSLDTQISMIGSLMFTASRPDIMFAVCACARHQVTPKECHLHDVKRIFRYLKGHPKLGLWYPKESPFDLVAYSDSDYGGATQDRKSTTKEYVAAASGYGQVLCTKSDAGLWEPLGLGYSQNTHARIPIIGAKHKGKEKVMESEVPKKRKLQEQIDAQVAREMEEEFAKENQRLSEQLISDYKIARLHAEEELKVMIEGLDRSNKVIAKHLREYKQAKADLSVGEKIELISELVKYQDNRARILKYQAQQSKPLSKKEQREFYMSVLRSHAGWKTKHFRGMTLEQIQEKFIPIWKQFKDFVPMSSKEESERLVPLEEVYIEALQVKHPIIDSEIHSKGKREYWKIIRLGGHTVVYQFFVDMLKQFDTEDLHKLWTLVRETFSTKQAIRDKEKELLGGHTVVYQFFVDMLKQFDTEDLHQLWTLVRETFSTKQAIRDKEKELWVELKRLFEPDFKD